MNDLNTIFAKVDERRRVSRCKNIRLNLLKANSYYRKEKFLIICVGRLVLKFCKSQLLHLVV